MFKLVVFLLLDIDSVFLNTKNVSPNTEIGVSLSLFRDFFLPFINESLLLQMKQSRQIEVDYEENRVSDISSPAVVYQL